MRKRRTREEKIKAKTKQLNQPKEPEILESKEDLGLIVHDLRKTGLIALVLLAILAAINFLKASPRWPN